jgi:Ca-activated chloride channel family protein
VRQDVLAVALQHQLLSPYTSFIAIEELVSRPAGDGLSSKPVANTRPRGQSPQVYAYPRTATTAPAKAWFAVLALFLAMMLCVLRRPEVDHVPSARA